jgi:glycosyltransferase involved in cell wall biosynthesis
MKVLCVVQGYAPSVGGSQWLTQQVAEHLVRDYGDQVTVYTTVAADLEHFHRREAPGLPAGVTTLNGVTVRRFPVFNHLRLLRRGLASLAYRLRLPFNDWLRTLESGPLVPGLRRAVAASDADVVFAMSFPLCHMYDALHGGRRAGIPVVLMGALHTGNPWGYDRPMIYRAIWQADAYLALTAYERDYVIGRGAAPERVRVVGAGVDLADYVHADGQAIRADLGWQDCPVVMTLARFIARKRFDLLLDAMRQVWRRVPDACLLLAGASSPYLAELRAAIAQLPQAKQVAVFADIPDEQKPDLLAAGDVFVSASAQESFGINFIEAWAAGAPVIGPDDPAIASVIDDGEDGLLFAYPDAADLARAILTLLDDPARRRALAARGLEKVRAQYTWDAITAQVRATYEAVIAEKTGPI